MTAIVALGAGCAIELDHEFDDAGASTDGGASAAPPISRGCNPLRQVSGVVSLAGDARSLPLANGDALWVVDQGALPDGGSALSPTFLVAGGARADCTAWSATFEGPAFAPSPLAPNGLLVALDLVQGSEAPALYYELFVYDAAAPLGLRALGYGLAPEDAATGHFVPTSELLWSSDRPAYGGSALRMGNAVYVYGCASAGFLTDDCFVARADPSRLASTAAYTYWTGDRWSSNPDDAAPIAQGGGIISVRPAKGGATGFVMTYVPPLGSTVVARRAIAPEGPWSAPETLASCDLQGAGPGAFCGGGQQHPELLPPGAKTLTLTYDARTFATDAGANGGAFWPRLTALSPP